MKKKLLVMALLLSSMHLFSQDDERKLTINPAKIAADLGNTSGRIDCSCCNNLAQDGGFEQLSVWPNTSDISTASTPWKKGMRSPQWTVANGPCNKGTVYMWGNQVFGESIFQNLSTSLATGNYKIKFIARQVNINNPGNIVRLKAIAFNGATPGVYNPSGPSVASADIGASWSTYTMNLVIPNGSYNSIVLHPENNFAVQDVTKVSWIQIDNICIERTCKIPDARCTPQFSASPFTLNRQCNIIIDLNPSVTAGAIHYWGVVGATDVNDITPIPLATILSGGTFGLGITSNGVATPIGMGTGINASSSGYGYHYEGAALGTCFKVTHYIKCCDTWYSQTKTYCVKLCVEVKEPVFTEVNASMLPDELN